jgi:uncharacterized protein YndB with AHSA1/START domain
MNTPLIIRKFFPVSKEKLYELFTNKEKMTHWFYDQDFYTADIKMDFRESGPFTIEIMTDIGASHVHTGEYFKIIPNQKLVFSWESALIKDSFVSLLFEDIVPHEQSILTLGHTNIHDQETKEAQAEFWQHCLRHLKNYIKNPEPFVTYHESFYDKLVG